MQLYNHGHGKWAKALIPTIIEPSIFLISPLILERLSSNFLIDIYVRASDIGIINILWLHHLLQSRPQLALASILVACEGILDPLLPMPLESFCGTVKWQRWT